MTASLPWLDASTDDGSVELADLSSPRARVIDSAVAPSTFVLSEVAHGRLGGDADDGEEPEEELASWIDIDEARERHHSSRKPE